MVATADEWRGGPAKPLDRAGPWIVEGELGRGGMSTVYAVVHETIGKHAALKVMHPRFGAAHLERVFVEARVANRIGHANVIDIFEIGTLDDDRPYIVMERLDGRTLGAARSELDLATIIDVLAQVADTVAAAHAAGVIHRDLKLDNLFLVGEPCAPRVKVLDWGLAKELSRDVRVTLEGTIVGTPQYLSPEQASNLPLTPGTDVYSLGVIAYELLAGDPPFVADSVAEVIAMHLRDMPLPLGKRRPDLARPLTGLVHAMLDKVPARRPSMRDVARQLSAMRAAEKTSSGTLAVPRACAAMTAELAGPRRCYARPSMIVAFSICASLAAGVLASTHDRTTAPPLPPTEPPAPALRSASAASVEPPPAVSRSAPARSKRWRCATCVLRVHPVQQATLHAAPRLDPDGTLEVFP